MHQHKTGEAFPEQLVRMYTLFGELLKAFADRERKSHERFTFLFQVKACGFLESAYFVVL